MAVVSKNDNILDHLPDSIARFDLNFRYVYVNRQFEINNNLRLADVLGKTLWEVGNNPRVCRFMEQRFKKVLRTKKPLTFEFPYHYRFGSQRLLTIITPEFDSRNQIVSLLGYSRNITENKKIQLRQTKYLLAQKELFETFFTHSPSVIILFEGPHHYIVEANPLAQTIAGSFRQVIGKTISEALPEIRGQGLIKILDRVYKTGKTFSGQEMPISLDSEGNGRLRKYYFNVVLKPIQNKKGKNTGILENAIDVTSLVENRLKIEDSERRFHDLSDNISQLVWTARPDGYRTWFNQRWLDYVGASTKEAEGWKFARFYHPNHRAGILKQLKTTFKSGQIWEDTFQIRRHDGVYRWFLARAVPIKDDSGQILRWFGSSTDITQQKNAEEALRKSERFFRTAFANANVGIAFTDRFGRYQYANPAYIKITGYTLAELFQLKYSDLIFPPDRKFNLDQVNLLIKKNIPGFILENRYLQKNGTPVWVRKSVSVIRDSKGKVENLVAIVEDITERKKTEEVLAAEKEQFKKLIDTIPVMISIFDTKLNINYFNKNFIRRTGWTKRLARSPHFMKKIIPNRSIRSQVTKFMKSPTSQWLDIPITTRNRKILETSWQTIKLSSELRLGIGIDIAARKELERKKDEFVSMASHELKTPITSLKVLVELMSEKLRRLGDIDNLNLAQRMSVQLNRIVSLVSDLLDVTKIQSGKMPMSREEFNINHLIEEIVNEISVSNKNHNNIVIQSTTNRTVIADRFRIGQVITNFLTNAIKYSPPNSKITVSAYNENDRIVVYIKDNGVGIPSEEFSLVFDRFFQSRRPRSDEGRLSSLGLGLYISAEIIKRHGGQIWLNSKVGKGSTFYFSLPAPSP